MRILFVGYLGRGQTSGMRCEGLRRLGHEVEAVDAGSVWSGASYLSRQLGQATQKSSRIDEFNAEVLRAATRFRPELVWAEKQEYLLASTVEQLQALGALVLHYNPDPYFSLEWKRTRLADECLKLYDILVVTKRYELQNYREYCHGRIIYSPLGYDPVGHAPPSEAVTVRDVAFVGGWEPRRERLLASAARASDSVTVWGYGWGIAQGSRANPLRALRLGRLTPGHRFYLGDRATELAHAIGRGESANGEIYENEYAKAIAGSRVSLGFVREICPDQHTTRTFEIPAIGGFMLADRTDEHLEFFEEGKEAEFFGSDAEYGEKLKYYLSHDEERDRIAKAGHQRCMTSGYSYDDRMKQVLSEL
jgi:spore maturation protein CgeB